jgi:hypothetical protein
MTVLPNLITTTETSVNPFWNEEDLKAQLSKGQSDLPAKYRDLPTTSAKIRAMNADGYSNSAITKMLKYADGRPIRYQHVRNVLTTPLKRS